MHTFESAPNQSITVGDVTYGYRLFGASYGVAVPLLMCMHFRGTMDHWDPALINPLAAQRPILLIDVPGAGHTPGTIPPTYKDWAAHLLAATLALKISQIDVLGFSMGGCTAQMVALTAPSKSISVRSLILCGTIPSMGEGVKRASDASPFFKLKKAATEEEHRVAFLDAMFQTSAASRAVGEKAWERIKNGRKETVKSDYVDKDGSRRQALAFESFMDPKNADEGSYNRFKELTMPMLIANGLDDSLLPTDNSYLMYKMAPNAQLHLYPDSGHGFIWQYADEFSQLINNFLDRLDRSKASRL